jgi:RNA recognition motif-containing protein
MTTQVVIDLDSPLIKTLQEDEDDLLEPLHFDKPETLPKVRREPPEEIPPYLTQQSAQYTKLFFYGIEYTLPKDMLLRVLSTFGKISKFNYPLEPDGTHRGLAFVTYETHEMALKAFR